MSVTNQSVNRTINTGTMTEVFMMWLIEFHHVLLEVVNDKFHQKLLMTNYSHYYILKLLHLSQNLLQ